MGSGFQFKQLPPPPPHPQVIDFSPSFQYKRLHLWKWRNETRKQKPGIWGDQRSLSADAEDQESQYQSAKSNISWGWNSWCSFAVHTAHPHTAFPVTTLHLPLRVFWGVWGPSLSLTALAVLNVTSHSPDSEISLVVIWNQEVPLPFQALAQAGTVNTSVRHPALQTTRFDYSCGFPTPQTFPNPQYRAVWENQFHFSKVNGELGKPIK
jgi:hypothetical protein